MTCPKQTFNTAARPVNPAASGPTGDLWAWDPCNRWACDPCNAAAATPVPSVLWGSELLQQQSMPVTFTMIRASATPVIFIALGIRAAAAAINACDLHCFGDQSFCNACDLHRFGDQSCCSSNHFGDQSCCSSNAYDLHRFGDQSFCNACDFSLLWGSELLQQHAFTALGIRASAKLLLFLLWFILESIVFFNYVFLCFLLYFG